MAKNPKIDPSPDDANEEYFNASLRHQVDLRRLSSGEVQRILELLEKADAALTRKLRKSLPSVAGKPRSDLATERIKALLRSIRETRRELIGQLKLALKEDLYELSKIEATAELRMLDRSLPVQIELASVPAETLRTLVTASPFSGGPAAARTLDQWFKTLGIVDQGRVTEAVQLGIIQGESTDDMVRRIVGTKRNAYADGVLATTRRNAETIVRTAVNHVSNAARESVWAANEDIISGLKWVSTLDGRTSAICRSRDGAVAPIGDKPLPKGARRLEPPEARPPAHPNCRSVMVAIIDGEGVANKIGSRPFVQDVRRRDKREMSFRQRAKERAGDRWTSLDSSQKNALVQAERDSWAKANIGQVPADTTYQQWLSKQPAKFQDEVLGPTKGKLFRQGDLTLDQFVDRKGNELTLAQLAERDPAAFMKAGLNPEDY